jgi:ribosomal protein S18 acetylase RimI-like enzyme
MTGRDPVSADAAGTRFARFDASRIGELMAWFPDAQSCRIWGGPQFRFPFSETSFREDAKLDSLASWMLVSIDGQLTGFGQYYLRLGHCHFGRLAIAPHARGRGLGGVLIREIAARGRAELGTHSYSLFVMHGNERALTLYRRLGFEERPYPEPSSMLAGSIFMVAPDPLATT